MRVMLAAAMIMEYQLKRGEYGTLANIRYRLSSSYFASKWIFFLISPIYGAAKHVRVATKCLQLPHTSSQRNHQHVTHTHKQVHLYVCQRGVNF